MQLSIKHYCNLSKCRYYCCYYCYHIVGGGSDDSDELAFTFLLLRQGDRAKSVTIIPVLRSFTNQPRMLNAYGL